MSESLKKFKNIIAEMFQFDQADLDFGIYRIMNQKREEINNFLDKDLLPQVKEAFSHYQAADRVGIQQKLDKLKSTLEDAGVKPEDSPKYKELKHKLASAVDVVALENEVFSDLTNFFKRYYDGGDFISLRRYKKDVYAIPYEGEEVKLHWANADQYYVKTTEYFRDYTFTLPSGRIVHFKIVDASTEQNNNKEQSGKERRFILCEEEPLIEENGELFIRFEYKAANGDKQKDLNNVAIKQIWKLTGYDKWVKELSILNPTEKNKTRTLLEKHLTDYTARNTFDYFIHKDLGGFLRRELDFYIKNEIMHLDDIDTENELRVEQYLSKIKVIKRIGHKIIAFLEQLENFQKKLWLKKKFVVETNYCITMDRVPKELYPQIIANQAQIEEWKRLFAIEELEAVGEQIGYSEPLTVKFLETNPYLVLDTVYFGRDFKEKLLSSIDDLDEKIDGLLIHSENFQALNFLQQRYKGKISGVYIDPPYNTEQDRLEGKFLYKDNYAHSTWITCLMDRLFLSRSLQRDDSSICISINEDEQYNLKFLLDIIYGPHNYMSTFAVKVRHENRILKGDKDFHEIYESLLLYRKSNEHIPNKRVEDNTSLEEYVWTVEIIGKPIKEIVIDNKTVKVYSEKSYKIMRKTPSKDRLKKISVRGSIREGNSSGRFYVANIEPFKDEYQGLLFQVPDMGDDGLGYRFFWCPDQKSGRKNGDYFQGVPINRKDTKLVPYPNMWDFEKEFNNCTDEGGMEFRNGKKPQAFLNQVLVLQNAKLNKHGYYLDFFAGSGSTGHAVISLNREDSGQRKYILVEMGEYFNTVLKPRLQKVIYSKDWKAGKPVSRQGSSHMFKYIRLESYEDTLNNLDLKVDKQLNNLFAKNPALREEYMLSYMLDLETKESASLLNINLFKDPFNYKLKVASGTETKECSADLIETFNYLLGLKINKIGIREQFTAELDNSSEKPGTVRLMIANSSDAEYMFQQVEGVNSQGEKVLLIWRNLTGNIIRDNAALNAYLATRKDYNTKDFKFNRIYVNGDNTLENLKPDESAWKVIMIEEEFKRLMFDIQGV